MPDASTLYQPPTQLPAALRNITPEAAAAEVLRRRRARTSLAAYIEYVSGQPVPRHGRYICSEIEAMVRGDFDRLLIAAPPGHMKSWICSHHFPAWYIGDHAQDNLIAASHTAEFASSWGRKVRNLVDSPEHKRVFPESGVTEDSRAADRWGFLGGGEYFAAGVEGTVTGKRANGVIIDDPIRGIKDAESEIVRNHLWDWYSNDLLSRLKKGGWVVIIATRWHLDDLTGRLINAEREAAKSGDRRVDKWRKIILPALARENDPLGRKYDEALWPEEYSEEFLRRRERSSSSSREFYCLYQQNPVPETGGIISMKWFRVWKQARTPKILYTIQSWDTALAANKTAAYSACTTWGVFMGEKWVDADGIMHDETGIPNAILLSAWRGRVEYPDLRKMAQRMARDYLDDKPDAPRKYAEGQKPEKPDLILVEAKANGLSLIQDLRRGGVMATAFNPDKHGDKTQRVKLVSDLIENGRIWVPGQPQTFTTLRPWAQELVEQVVSFPAMESRDFVDSMTQALLRLKLSSWVFNTENPPVEPPPDRMARKPLY